MKVVIIIPTLGIAGAEVMCKNLAIGLKKKKIEVVLISLYNIKSILAKEIAEDGIKIIFLNKHIGFDWTMTGKIKEILKAENPDVVHTHLDCLKYSAIAAAQLDMNNCVHTIHNIAEKESPAITRIINKIIFKRLNVIPVALSEEIQESVANVYKLNKKNVPVVYNGINLNKFIPKDSYQSKGKMRFVHVGRFAEQKNHKLLIDAFYEFLQNEKNAELILIGKGELQKKVKKQVCDYQIESNVIFMGERTDVAEILHMADVFLLPSKYEGMPISIIEAMGTGLPIIATKVGGVPSMIQNNISGILIDCNKKTLVQAMLVLRNEKIREKLEKEALKKAIRYFSAEKMVNEYIDIYKYAISRKKNNM